MTFRTLNVSFQRMPRMPMLAGTLGEMAQHEGSPKAVHNEMQRTKRATSLNASEIFFSSFTVMQSGDCLQQPRPAVVKQCSACSRVPWQERWQDLLPAWSKTGAPASTVDVEVDDQEQCAAQNHRAGYNEPVLSAKPSGVLPAGAAGRQQKWSNAVRACPTLCRAKHVVR